MLADLDRDRLRCHDRTTVTRRPVLAPSVRGYRGGVAARSTRPVPAALAEFELNLIRERTSAGLAAARARGRSHDAVSASEVELSLRAGGTGRPVTRVPVLRGRLAIGGSIPMDGSGVGYQRASGVSLSRVGTGPSLVLPPGCNALLSRIHGMEATSRTIPACPGRFV